MLSLIIGPTNVERIFFRSLAVGTIVGVTLTVLTMNPTLVSFSIPLSLAGGYCYLRFWQRKQNGNRERVQASESPRGSIPTAPSLPESVGKACKVFGLQLPPSSSQLKVLYRDFARQLHPDVNPGDPTAEQKMKDLNDARDVLAAYLLLYPDTDT